VCAWYEVGIQVQAPGALAQRLVRKLCPACKSPYEASDADRKIFGNVEAPERLYRATGCGACNFTGYKGRTGIYELLTVDDELRRLIHSAADERELRDHALTHGMIRLRDDGLRWVSEGVTSLDEVLRVTRT
jgi:general secretion pathway protein E